MPFPSVLNSFSRPSTTSRLNNPSHSALHNDVSSAVGQIEQVIGRDGNNSVAGSLIYQIRSPDSDGGGHVQVANKGGTGQTTFTKGDLLVATSASVVAKLAVGLDGKILVADSSVAAGIKWADSGTRLFNSASVVTLLNSVAETSIFSVSVPGSTLGTTGALRATMYVTNFGQAGTSSMLVKANYGSNTVSSILVNADLVGSIFGKIEHVLIANAATNVQRGNLLMDVNRQKFDAQSGPTSVLGVYAFATGTSSVESSANNTYGITCRQSRADAAERIDITGIIVEKII